MDFMIRLKSLAQAKAGYRVIPLDAIKNNIAEQAQASRDLIDALWEELTLIEAAKVRKNKRGFLSKRRRKAVIAAAERAEEIRTQICEILGEDRFGNRAAAEYVVVRTTETAPVAVNWEGKCPRTGLNVIRNLNTPAERKARPAPQQMDDQDYYEDMEELGLQAFCYVLSDKEVENLVARNKAVTEVFTTSAVVRMPAANKAKPELASGKAIVSYDAKDAAAYVAKLKAQKEAEKTRKSLMEKSYAIFSAAKNLAARWSVRNFKTRASKEVVAVATKIFDGSFGQKLSTEVINFIEVLTTEACGGYNHA